MIQLVQQVLAVVMAVFFYVAYTLSDFGSCTGSIEGTWQGLFALTYSYFCL